jgi:hypothetical protein
MRAHEFITHHTQQGVKAEQEGYSYAELVDNLEITDAEKPEDGKLMIQVIKRVGGKTSGSGR